MCGIAGIIKLNFNDTVEDVRLKRMRDTMIHRGPDDEGMLIDGPVGLAHRRLSIVDLAGGHQPMANEARDIWVVFNGEIYNHADLRAELESKGHRYRSRSDTETILHLYEEEGDHCVERLQGMFAFGLWDRKRRHVLLARDRLGIKPLYYASTGHELLFASEIKAILEVTPELRMFDETVLPEFLALGFVSGEETFFRGVRKVLPGRTLSWSPDTGLRTRRYWQLPVSVSTSEGSNADNLKAVAEEVRIRLEATVRSHLMSDVPLGVFLSGGIDSTAIAALMSSIVQDQIHTFAVGFDDVDANELPYARIAAHAIGAKHREVVVSPEEYFAALPNLIWHEDEPIAFPSSVPLYFVARLAREDVKVVLTGEGADELFLGYNRYRVTAWNDRLGRYYWKIPQGVREEVGTLLRFLPKSLGRYAGRTFLTLSPDPRKLYFENFAIFSQTLQQNILVPALRTADPYATALLCYGQASGDLLGRMSQVDMETYLVELLMKQDQMSMAASIESRVPFLDHVFVEHVAALPGHYKLRGWRTKAVFREAVRDIVPAEILTRRKMGFPVPVGRWLRGSFWPLVEEFVLGPRARQRGYFNPSVIASLAAEHRSGKAEHGHRLWLLVNLEIWQRLFIEREDPLAIMKAV